jgi:predicted ATPase
MIERLYVHNFRCLENFALDLAGHPAAVLIGKNGAGKSTVLGCLEVFQGTCRGASRVKHLLSAYIIASNTVGPPVICMWDEPDNHLSSSEVGQFITSLRKMTKRSDQFIATTHHPETVRKLGGSLSTDGVHEPLGLNEPRGVDFMSLPLGPHAIANGLDDFVVGGSAAEQPAHVGFCE